ncbi:Protein kinase 157785 isoform 1 [Phytophthora megakarya]|uniref:Protein kinase 157785 isoform 1 n=1 Tax=Phytophthora megakarya TaxID=4795 RepID=A0A225W088_9STRA|nr:Protein kinase 157785 isoform 1 [Phytophthora megakarya]
MEHANTAELHPKRTTSFAASLRKKPPVQHDLATRIAMEREKTKYWARILLLFPLVPVCLALTTIVFGGVIVNVATNDCNADLMRFLQGAVVLSHVLVCFYTYCWMGPWPIKSLRTVRVFYLGYGVVCVAWWGLYGTLQAVTATNSGFESCLAMSPTLYIFSQFEVAAFWIVFIAAVAFVGNEMTAHMRKDTLSQWAKKKEDAKRARQQQEQETRDRVLQDAQEQARKLEEEQRQKLAAEQKDLYGSDDSDAEREDMEDDDGTNEYDNRNDPEEEEDEEEEEAG